MIRNKSLAAIAFLASLVVLMVTTGSADAAGFTREQRLARANTVMSQSLDNFLITRMAALGSKPKSPIDKTLDWGADGCSTPDFLDSTGLSDALAQLWSVRFLRPCQRHDFGYRNFGKNYYTEDLALEPSNAKKAYVDSTFARDMAYVCKTKYKNSTSCRDVAASFYLAVSKKGDDAFHNHECTPNKLCLFEDDYLSDTRWMFSTSHPSMDPYDFHDQADSLWNTSKYAWIVYEDENYQDSSKCIPPGAIYPRLDAQKWGDQIDSIRLTSATHC